MKDPTAIFKLIGGLQDRFHAIEREREKTAEKQPGRERGDFRLEENAPKIADGTHTLRPAAGGDEEQRRIRLAEPASTVTPSDLDSWSAPRRGGAGEGHRNKKSRTIVIGR